MPRRAMPAGRSRGAGAEIGTGMIGEPCPARSPGPRVVPTPTPMILRGGGSSALHGSPHQPSSGTGSDPDRVSIGVASLRALMMLYAAFSRVSDCSVDSLSGYGKVDMASLLPPKHRH